MLRGRDFLEPRPPTDLLFIPRSPGEFVSVESHGEDDAGWE
jgi:hypothetical protein